MDEFTIDKTVFSIVDSHDISEEKAYWLKKSPQERLAAVEFMRIINYGEDATAQRLSRFFEIA